MKWALMSITVALTAYSQIVLKWRLDQFSVIPESILGKMLFYFTRIFDPFIFSSFLAAFLGSITYMMALNQMELTVAYPAMSMSYVFVLIMSHYIMGEDVNIIKVAGTLLILIGVVLVANGNASRV